MELIRRSLSALRGLAAGRPAWLVVLGALVVLPVWAVTAGLAGLLFEVVSRLDDLRAARLGHAPPAPLRVRWGGTALAWLLTIAVVGSVSAAPTTTGPAPAPSTPHGTATSARPTPSRTDFPTATPTAPRAAEPAPTPSDPPPTPTAAPTEAAFRPTGPNQAARVVRVIDGDTIEVEVGGRTETVRYIGIDTPETKAPDRPVEWMGPEATAANERLVDGTTVVLETDASERDRFGRLLRHVWLEADGGEWLLVNLLLVEQGFAAVSTYPPDVKYVDLLLEGEREARDASRGLWGDPPAPDPTPKPTVEPPAADDCHPSYDPCLPVVGDLDCPDVRAMGKAPVRIKGPDDYRLDRDEDGLGCE